MRFTTLGAAAVICYSMYGQTPDAKLEFEVASIKPAPSSGFFHASDSGSGGPGTSDPTTFHCNSCPLSSLLLKAFALERYQVPALASLPPEAYAVSAKVPAGTTPEQFRVMLQNLLKERFGLVYHFDKKEMQGYQLVLAKNGPKLVESKESTAPADTPQHAAQGQWSHGGGADGGHGATGSGVSFFNGGAQYRSDHQTAGQLTEWIANQIAKPVDDQTGLKGKYDISLSWSGDTAHSDHPAGASGYAGGAEHDHGGGGGGAGNASTPSDGTSGPTLFDALQSQLGLKLVAAAKSTAKVLVVDHVEKTPTMN